MRYVNGFLCVVLALFAVLQYNDPDALWWFLIYALPAAFAGIAAFRSRLYAEKRALALAFWPCLALALALTAWYWPIEWHNWIHIEETREGIGMWIVMLTMLTTAATVWQQAHGPRVPAAA